jgi:hypothetical protein
MKNLRIQARGVVLAVALMGALAGCNSVNLDKAPLAAGLAGKKTFTVTGIYGGGVVTGAGGAATAAAAQAIQDIFVQHGYGYQASGPVDFLVAASWQYNMSMNPFSTQAQMNAPAVTPTNVQQITLSVVARDPTSNDLLWRGATPMPITTATLTPDGAVMLVREALKNLPVAKPAESKP